jgi:hypothetical protein
MVPQRPVHPLRVNGNAFMTLISPVGGSSPQPFIDGQVVVCDAVPQISIPSPTRPPEDSASREDDPVVGLSLSFLDDNSRSDLDGPSRALSSTPTHLQSDHFLDSVLENSSNSLLQTPRRSSPPPSPPGGMSEHSWMPDLSLTSFLGSLPSDAHSSDPKLLQVPIF